MGDVMRSAMVVASAVALTWSLSGCSGTSSRTTKVEAGPTPEEISEAERLQKRQFSEEDIKRREAPSKTFEGLTVGEVEDMPAVPDLPRNLGLQTTVDQLSAHCAIVAREEVASGSAKHVSVAARQSYLLQVWSALLSERQQELGAVANDRADLAADYQANHVRNTDWQRRNKIVDHYNNQIWNEQLNIYESLTDEERSVLGR